MINYSGCLLPISLASVTFGDGGLYTHPVHVEEPVFVDATGRRRSLARKAGLLLGALLLGYGVVLGISLGTGADVPMVTWVVPNDHKPLPGQAEHKVTKKPESPISAQLRKNADAPSVNVAPTTASKIAPSASPRTVPTATPSVTLTATPSATPTHGNKPTAPPGKSKKNNT
jgi:hypothetical protein